jgi:GAF domain-containing protein
LAQKTLKLVLWIIDFKGECKLEFTKALNKIKKILITSSNIFDDIVNFLYQYFEHYNWVGIYVINENKLVLKSWKGPKATEHKQIAIGNGICGHVAITGKTEIIPDVGKDKRYLSCFLSTHSEIVVPIKKEEKIFGEIDIDSDRLNAFSENDVKFLEKIADMLEEHI